MVKILSKRTWLASSAVNLSANNCFSTYFNYADPLRYQHWREVGACQDEHLISWTVPRLHYCTASQGPTALLRCRTGSLLETSCGIDAVETSQTDLCTKYYAEHNRFDTNPGICFERKLHSKKMFMCCHMCVLLTK